MEFIIRNSMNLIESLKPTTLAALRLCFVFINNIYCIPTYVLWMVLLLPLRRFNSDLYWRIEGYFFHWLLAMVSMWSWSAGYDIVELGDNVSKCVNERTLIIANHQSTADVPMLMACFNAKSRVLPNIMWIMDRLFKFTNFGIVSVLHRDFFILSGREAREKGLRELSDHLLESFIPLKRKWMVLFPEGGFLHKRRNVSQSYANKNNLPLLQHVTLPRVGAMGTIMKVMAPVGSNEINSENNNSEDNLGGSNNECSLNWVIDITIAYPGGKPLDLPTIIFGMRPPCKTLMFYRVYRCSDVPRDQVGMTSWLYARFEEKEQMLDTYYKTGTFPVPQNAPPPRDVQQDCLRFIILHLFFITSTYLHIRLFSVLYDMCLYFLAYYL